MAVADFNFRMFSSAAALAEFVATDDDITEVISIIFDNNGQYVVFFI